MWTESDDEDVAYGVVKSFTAKDTHAELLKVHPPADIPEIWPSWSDGVPTKFQRQFYCERFYANGVHHQPIWKWETLELRWKETQLISSLVKNYGLLPSANSWSGVYRIFSLNAVIDRCCGKDASGTLYVGRAGTGRGWSTLRTRIVEITKGGHHATEKRRDVLRDKYPWSSWAVQWAYTGMRVDHAGKEQHVAKMAEGFLLWTYLDTYGELPPLNEKF